MAVRQSQLQRCARVASAVARRAGVDVSEPAGRGPGRFPRRRPQREFQLLDIDSGLGGYGGPSRLRRLRPVSLRRQGFPAAGSGSADVLAPASAMRAVRNAGNHFVVTLIVVLLFARFESSCGRTVWTEAVFTICWATLEARTVTAIVA